MNAKRVIFVTPDIVGPVKNGGIGTACFHYARVLVAAGYAVDILFAGWELDAAETLRWRAFYADLGIGFFALNETPPVGMNVYGQRWYTETAWRVFQWLKDRAADLVLFQDWKAEGLWSIRARRCGAAFAHMRFGVIVHSPAEWQAEGMQTFGEDALYQADLAGCERDAIAGADVVLSPSRYMLGWMRDHDFALPGRVEVCPIPFTDTAPEPIERPIDRSHLILFGRLETRKGLGLLGEALAELRARDEVLPRKISLLGKHGLMGGAPSARYVDRLRRDNPEIEFAVETELDYRAALEYIAVENGVVVVTSLVDNFPLTVLESIQHGFPLVAAETGGIPEMVDPRALFAPTAKGLADMIAAIPDLDFDFRHAYAASAAAERWLEVIGSVLSEPAEPARPALVKGAPPKISVCIPFYRHDRYLGRLTTAFLEGSIPVQLVIVDDGTPEGERPVLDALASDLRAAGHLVLRQANAGPGAARNAAVEAAANDHLIFFDADNVPFPDMAERLWTAMQRTEADSVAAPFYAVPPMQETPAIEDAAWAYLPSGVFSALSLVENTLGDMTSLVRRDAVAAAGGFPTNIGKPGWEDWEFFLRLIAAGRRHRVYPEPLVFYTDHPDRQPTPEFTHALRLSLLGQLDGLDPKLLLSLTKTLAAEAFVLKDAGKW